MNCRGIAAGVVIAVTLVAAPSFAGDIVFTPTGNMVKDGAFEFNYILWSFDNPPGPDHMSIYEFFFGLDEHLEIDIDILSPDPGTAEGTVNVYVPVILETPNRPSLIIGTYNLFANGLPLGPVPDDRVSPFVLTAYNLHAPDGPPSLKDPLLRAHLGYGWGLHDMTPFGGLQFLVDPHFGGAVLNHSGDPAYMATFIPCPEKHDWEITIGTLAGEEFYRVGWFHTW